MKHLTIEPKFLCKEFYAIAKLPIPIGNEYVLLHLSSIVRLEADGYCTKIFTTSNSKTIVTSINLGYYEDLLPAHSFIRLHNKHIVNVNFIEKITCCKHWCVELRDKTILNISDEKRKTLLETLGLKPGC